MIPITNNEEKIGKYLTIKGKENISLENNINFIFNGPEEEYLNYIKTIKLFLFFNNIKYIFVNRKLNESFHMDYKQITYELEDVYHGKTKTVKKEGVTELSLSSNINMRVEMDIKAIAGIMEDDERTVAVNNFFTSILNIVTSNKDVDRFVFVTDYFNNETASVVSYSNFVALITILEVLSSTTNVKKAYMFRNKHPSISKQIKTYIRKHHQNLKFFRKKLNNVTYDIYEIRSQIVHRGNVETLTTRLLNDNTFEEVYFELRKIIVQIIKSDFKRIFNVKKINIFDSLSLV